MTTMNASHRNDSTERIATMVQQALPEVMAVYVYGTAARGDARPDSDIDIGVLLPPGNQLPDKLALSAKLQLATGCQLDLVDLRQAGNLLRMEVLKEGRQILNSPPGQVLAWEAHAMGEYARHRAAIADILQDFHDTGIGHHR